MNWQGKTAFITGGVSGIGFGIACAFAGVSGAFWGLLAGGAVMALGAVSRRLRG